MSTARIQGSTTSLQVSTNRLGFLGGSVAKNMPANAEDAKDAGLIPGSFPTPRDLPDPGIKPAKDAGLIPGSGRSLGVGNDNLFQFFLLGKLHGQRSLVGYCPWGSQKVGHD